MQLFAVDAPGKPLHHHVRLARLALGAVALAPHDPHAPAHQHVVVELVHRLLRCSFMLNVTKYNQNAVKLTRNLTARFGLTIVGCLKCFVKQSASLAALFECETNLAIKKKKFLEV